ncbi:hypothetical protein ABIC47_003751 [Leifsonia sp. 563]|uniref:hypothetical protein n=1 Tax=Leifsonia sp. 563 TaxID=3156412 RepID=UPI00339AE252
MKKALIATAVAASVLTGSVLTAAPASAMWNSGSRTNSCGAGKSVQVNWKSTGNVRLFKYSNNTGLATEKLVREVFANGSYAYNSGLSTLTWQFGTAPGNVTSYSVTCVGQF